MCDRIKGDKIGQLSMSVNIGIHFISGPFSRPVVAVCYLPCLTLFTREMCRRDVIVWRHVIFIVCLLSKVSHTPSTNDIV